MYMGGMEDNNQPLGAYFFATASVSARSFNFNFRDDGNGNITPHSYYGDYLLSRPNDHETRGTLWYGFGSWHPMICQFVMGDGAVRSISVTTPASILNRLGIVDDGGSISLP